MPLRDVGLPDVGRWVFDLCQRLCCCSGLRLRLQRQTHQHLDAFEALLLAGTLRQVVEHIVQNDGLIGQHFFDSAQVASDHLSAGFFQLGHQVHDFDVIAAGVFVQAERTQAGARRHSGQTL